MNWFVNDGYFEQNKCKCEVYPSWGVRSGVGGGGERGGKICTDVGLSSY